MGQVSPCTVKKISLNGEMPGGYPPNRVGEGGRDRGREVRAVGFFVGFQKLKNNSKYVRIIRPCGPCFKQQSSFHHI